MTDKNEKNEKKSKSIVLEVQNASIPMGNKFKKSKNKGEK